MNVTEVKFQKEIPDTNIWAFLSFKVLLAPYLHPLIHNLKFYYVLRMPDIIVS